MMSVTFKLLTLKLNIVVGGLVTWYDSFRVQIPTWTAMPVLVLFIYVAQVRLVRPD